MSMLHCESPIKYSRLLVCGGREYDDWKLFQTIMKAISPKLSSHFVLIHGGARGADQMADYWAEYTQNIPRERILTFPANWDKYGNKAGSIRNQQMIDEGRPDYAVAFPGGTGTFNMIWKLKKAGIPLFDVRLALYKKTGTLEF